VKEIFMTAIKKIIIASLAGGVGLAVAISQKRIWTTYSEMAEETAGFCK